MDTNEGDKNGLLLVAVKKSRVEEVMRLVKCIDELDPEKVRIAYDVAKIIGKGTIIHIIGNALEMMEERKKNKRLGRDIQELELGQTYPQRNRFQSHTAANYVQIPRAKLRPQGLPSSERKAKIKITDDIATIPPDGSDEDIRDDTEAIPSKLLIELGIEEVASFKFGMKDILNISKCSLDWKQPVTLKEKLLYIISKFIMLDRSPYDMSLDIKENPQTGNDNFYPSQDDKKDIESEFNAMFGESGDISSQVMQNVLHPSDVIVILMNCCDTFVRQALIQKMRTCQLAIPLILPDIINEKQLFLLWPMRHLQLHWKTTKLGHQSRHSADSDLPKISAHEGNPVDKGIPIISAIKLGTFSNSKSKILNNILCTQTNDIFFHKHCTAGQLSRKISNGVVELTWYLPGGKDKDSFEECWTLANLRGDAQNHEMQFRLLKQVSPIMLVFISLETIVDNNVQNILEQLSNSNTQLVFVFLDPVSPVSNEKKKQCQSIFIEMFSTLMRDKKCSFVAESGVGKERNEATLKTEISDKIKQSLQNLRARCNEKYLTLEDVSHQADIIGFSIDENNKYCQKGKSLANEIMEKLLHTEAKDRKNNILPLQGTFKSWSEYSKQLHRMEEVDSNKMYGKMQRCRKKQFDKVKNMTPLVKGFIKIVTEEKNFKMKMYFLQWMKIYLDAQSKLHLPKQEKKYHALWNNIKNKKEYDIKELEKLERMLDDLSFGLEHILREIGQVYEAIKFESRNTELEKLADDLAKFGADLLIGGYPLEILDGDASHLPLTWIRAVLQRLKDRLGDKKVYVISVLGVQSSGKSTLLNTMFGVNFSVSAGRCTKGVFAQLIAVEKELFSKLGYEYILILDTEGLRAMELGRIKQKHDNELASFIIGMGAVTIVNNKGENTAEIGDVLQICVHAFLRMRLANDSINLQPGCYFAHQNVPDVNAESKMLYGFKKLKDQLDDIAIEAAKHENVVSEINSFSDVIQFDVNKQICYFPNLWIGDPPMAPANPGYSEKVLKLKRDIIRYPNTESSLSFSKLEKRLFDLWKAILNENFVFSFKNSQEVRCYSYLEEKILDVSREFHNKVKIEMNKYINRINSCDSDFNKLNMDIISELTSFIRQCQATCKEQLDVFFSSSADKDILIQWESFAKHKLDEIVLDLKNDEINKISTTIDLRKADYENLKELGSYKHEVEKFVRKMLATGIASQLSKDELDKKFEENWEKFVNGLHIPKIKEKKNITEEVRRFLRDQYRKDIAIGTVDSFHNTEIVKIDDSDFGMTGLWAKMTISPKEKHDIKIEIENFTYRISQIINEYLNSIEDQDYEIHFLRKIKEKFEKRIESFNRKDDRYKLSKKFAIKVISQYLLDAIPHFEKMQRKFRKKNDQKSMIDKIYKPKSKAIFIGTYTQCNKEITAAKILGESLETAILDSMNSEIPGVISNKLLADKTEFHSKIKLISKVLRDLQSNGDFKDYYGYIHKPQQSLESYIEKYVKKYCTEKQNDQQSMVEAEVNILFRGKVEIIMSCIESVSLNSKPTFQTWLMQFNNAVKRNGSIPLTNTFINLFDMKEVEVKNIEHFRDEMSKIMRKIEVKNENVLNTWSNKELHNMTQKTSKTICKSILGCMQQCPFCKCICSCTFTHLTDDKKTSIKHSARHHCPSGIAGYRMEKTQELMIDSCNENQASDWSFKCGASNNEWVKFKDYRTVNLYYDSWDIQPDRSMEALAYWKWVFGKFSKDFAESYNAKDNNVPSEWKDLSSNTVEASIETM